MTLVQNLRLPLNGNNLLVILFLLIGCSSCAAKKITASEHKTERIEVGPDDKRAAKKAAKKVDVVPIQPASPVSSEDSVLKKPVIFDLDDAGTAPAKTSGPAKTQNNDPNRIHNIAVILPFNLDQIPLGQYVDDSTKQLSTDSRNAVEFYLGCQMAREKFRSDKVNSNVYFIDDQNDSMRTVSLFRQKPFPNVDYIIGPLNYTNIKMAAELAKSEQIPLIAPVANSMYIADNPYFFSANASLKSQYNHLLEHTKSKFPDKALEVIYDGRDSLAESIGILKAIAEQHYGYGKIRYTSLGAADDITGSMTQADTLSERVVLIYSSKEAYVKSVLAKLKPVKNKLHIFTSSCAKNTKSLADTKYPHVIYTVYPYNTNSPNYSVFAMRFEEKYEKKPGEMAAQAFDILMHLLNTMDKQQTLQDNMYHYTTDFDNTQTRFRFKPQLNKNGGIDYYDNTFMYLYKYVNGVFVLVTP